MPMPLLDRRLLIAVAATAMLASGVGTAATPKSAADKAYASVDPFIGTGGEGHTYPGATVPFGMVQLSPDTRIQPREKAYGWAAGYRYDDSSIVGFSHTHFSGTGHSDLGDILVMPFTSPAWNAAIRKSRAAAMRRASAMTTRRPSPATTRSPSTTTRCAPS